MTQIEPELKDFVRESLKQIDAGLGKNYQVKDTISFEISVIKSVDETGKMGIKVIEAGQNVSSGEISEIKFEVERVVKE